MLPVVRHNWLLTGCHNSVKSPLTSGALLVGEITGPVVLEKKALIVVCLLELLEEEVDGDWTLSGAMVGFTVRVIHR